MAQYGAGYSIPDLEGERQGELRLGACAVGSQVMKCSWFHSLIYFEIGFLVSGCVIPRLSEVFLPDSLRP